MIDVDAGDDGRDRPGRRSAAAPGDAARPAAARGRAAAGHAHAAGDRPGALDPARQRRAGRQPHAGHGRLEGPERRGPRPRAAPRRRRRRRDRAHAQGPRRDPAHPRPGRPAGADQAWARETPYLVAEVEELPDDEAEGSTELEALTRNVRQTFSAIVEDLPYLPEELQLAVANVDDPGALSHLIAGVPAAPARGEAGAPGGGRRRPPPAAADRDPRPRARGHLDRDEDPDPGPVRDRQGPARVRPAPAARGDPARARRVRRVRRGGRPAARAPRADPAAGGGPPPGRPRAQAPGVAPAAGRRARGHPHLAGVDRVAALGRRAPRTTSTCTTRARCSTPTTTTSSRSRTASSSSWPCGA